MFLLGSDTPFILNRSLGDFFSRIPRELHPGNPERTFSNRWQSTISLYGMECNSEKYQHEECWGWNILRTSYEDDEKFTRAISAIHRLALVRLEEEYWQSRTSGQPDNQDVEDVYQKLEPFGRTSSTILQQAWRSMVGPARVALPSGEPLTPDWVITYELVRKYHNIVIQDKDALDGADVANAWNYAQLPGIRQQDVGPRGEFFIYLDKESIDMLANAPSQEELATLTLEDRCRVAFKYWVKAVSNSCKVDSDDEDTDQITEDEWGRRRLRLYDFFDLFIHLCSGDLTELAFDPGSTYGEWEFGSTCDSAYRHSQLQRGLQGN